MKVSRKYSILALELLEKQIMIAVSNTTAVRQEAKVVHTGEHLIAGTVSVDEYFDELISLVHQDYADL